MNKRLEVRVEFQRWLEVTGLPEGSYTNKTDGYLLDEQGGSRFRWRITYKEGNGESTSQFGEQRLSTEEMYEALRLAVNTVWAMKRKEQ